MIYFFFMWHYNHTQSKSVAISKTGTCIPENTSAVYLMQERLCCVLCNKNTALSYWNVT